MNVLLIDEGKPSKCELCGKEEELRPYGPGGKRVCFDCAMKDEEEAKRQFLKVIENKDLIIIK